MSLGVREITDLLSKNFKKLETLQNLSNSVPQTSTCEWTVTSVVKPFCAVGQNILATSPGSSIV